MWAKAVEALAAAEMEEAMAWRRSVEHPAGAARVREGSGIWGGGWCGASHACAWGVKCRVVLAAVACGAREGHRGEVGSGRAHEAGGSWLAVTANGTDI